MEVRTVWFAYKMQVETIWMTNFAPVGVQVAFAAEVWAQREFIFLWLKWGVVLNQQETGRLLARMHEDLLKTYKEVASLK